MRRDWTYWLRSWPLLIAATILVGFGAWLLAGSENRDEIGTVLVVLGAVCLGSWIALLASHGHTGKDDGDGSV